MRLVFVRTLLLLCLITGISISAAAQKRDSIHVIIFLSETCPICQSTTLEIKDVYNDYHGKGISFTGFFPSPNMSTDETRQKFAKKYAIPFALSSDKDQKQVRSYAATTTPEVFVVRTKDNAILYRGKVDNSYEAIGKRRQVVTQHYLRNALENILQHKPVSPAKTDPVGCYISKT